MVVIIAVFLPGIGYDQFYFSGMNSIDIVPVALIFSPLLYIVLSLATLFFGIRIMRPPAEQSGKTTPQAADGHKDSEEIMLQNLAKRSGLSVREITIIPLMARGLGNKQIALELHISPKTVGNHIYNIYRKLDISSRYELLALLK